MAKDGAKKAKLSKKARRKAARRRRLIRDLVLYLCLMALCIGCLALMPLINRAKEPENTWYIQNGSLEIAAPAMSASGLNTASGRYATTVGRSDGDRQDASGLPDMPSRASARPTATATPLPATPEPTEAPTSTPEPQPVTITITAAGDCTLGGSVNQDTYHQFRKALKQNGYDYFFANVRHVFQADDLTILNLEGPLTDVGEGHGGSYCFKGDPDYVQIMTGSSVELCNVANNHSMDFGRAGLNRTAEVLEQAGIGCCGYSKVYHTTVKGVRITALGFDKWRSDKAGIVQTIRQERPNCDLLIVNMHWGREKHFEPMADQKDWGHAAIDAGADLIIGTHPHVYGGVELYKGKYIAYSLGNFCFGGNDNPSDKRCLMFQQTFVVSPSGQVTDGGINVIPCSVSSVPNKNNYQPTIMAGAEGTRLLKAMSRYSNFTKDSTLWMLNSYPEQVGLITADTVLPPNAPLATAVPRTDFALTAQAAGEEEPEEDFDWDASGLLEDGEDTTFATTQGTAEESPASVTGGVTGFLDKEAVREEIYLDQMQKN